MAFVFSVPSHVREQALGRPMGRGFTHVVRINGGEMADEISPLADREFFASVLRRRDGRKRWGLGLFPVPENITYVEMLDAGEELTEYLQDGVNADALTVEISKPVGAQWGCDWVRYVVGHPHEPGLPLGVDILMPGGPKRFGGLGEQRRAGDRSMSLAW